MFSRILFLFFSFFFFPILFHLIYLTFFSSLPFAFSSFLSCSLFSSPLASSAFPSCFFSHPSSVTFFIHCFRPVPSPQSINSSSFAFLLPLSPLITHSYIPVLSNLSCFPFVISLSFQSSPLQCNSPFFSSFLLTLFLLFLFSLSCSFSLQFLAFFTLNFFSPFLYPSLFVPPFSYLVSLKNNPCKVVYRSTNPTELFCYWAEFFKHTVVTLVNTYELICIKEQVKFCSYMRGGRTNAIGWSPISISLLPSVIVYVQYINAVASTQTIYPDTEFG